MVATLASSAVELAVVVVTLVTVGGRGWPCLVLVTRVMVVGYLDNIRSESISVKGVIMYTTIPELHHRKSDNLKKREV